MTAEVKQGMSRRDFLKIAGLAGAAVQVGGFLAGGKATGSSSETYTGWESYNSGTQFFNRKPFEVEYPNFTPIAEVRRPSHLTDYVFGRVGMFQKAYEAKPEWTLDDPIEDLGFPPPLIAFYKKFPERLEWDYITFSETIPNNSVDRKEYGAFYTLLDVYEAGFGSINPKAPTSPPEESDFTMMGRGGPQPLGDKIPFKSPELATEFFKEISHRFGATLVRMTVPNIDWHYGDGWRGCPPEYDHSKLPAHYKSAIVVGVPMEWDEVLGSPNISTSYDAYARVSIAAVRIEGALKKMGYASRASTPNSSYDMVVPPYAVDAGLGEHCRAGYIIAPETGSNCRTAVIMTELELAPDKPIEFGVKEFCNDCKICAEQCPSGAISFADSYEGLEIRGYEHWYINNGACYNFWRESMGGMGCRLCVANCPYSRKDNWLHDMSRQLDPRDPTGIVRGTLLWMQKNFFDAPEALDYRRIAEGGHFAQYRDEPYWLHGETYLDIPITDPKEVK
jgi:epoxyqueuosine reductase